MNRDRIRTITERHDTSPKVTRVEGYVDTRERDSRKATLKLDVTLGLLLLLGFLEARIHDFPKHLLDLLHTELLGQLNG